MKHIGISGTREGMSKLQKETFLHFSNTLTTQFTDLKYFHQGQCQGVDVEAARLLKSEFNLFIVSHPPVKKDLLGQCTNDIVKQAKGYFARNRDIVNASELMFILPKESQVQSTGGTWYTYKYALAANKPVILILPDGSYQLFNCEFLK